MNEDRIADVLIIIAIITVIVLKLCNVITISWLWLTSIVWIPFLVGVGFAAFIMIWFIVSIIYDKIKGE